MRYKKIGTKFTHGFHAEDPDWLGMFTKPTIAWGYGISGLLWTIVGFGGF